MGVSTKKVLLGAALSAPLLALAYARWVRPWHLTWGVQDDEATRWLPGDDLIAAPKMQATHAITIEATPQLVWPWLVQMGQGRGGFYSYSWLENLVGCQMENADRIVPELQVLRVGDPIWLHPNAAPMQVKVMDVERALVYYGGREAFSEFSDRNADLPDPSFASSWAFILEDAGENGTRLIVRNRSTYGPGIQQEMACRCLLEPLHFVMERKLLRTLKWLVEGRKKNWIFDAEDDEPAPMFV